MKHKLTTLAHYLCLALLLLTGGFTHATDIDSRLDWRTLETDHFLIHYASESQWQAEKAARLGEGIHRELTPVLQWQPREKTHVVLVDQSDLTNGSATAVPFNWIHLWTSPPHEINSLEDYDDWLYRVFLHEYTHVLHLDKVGPSPENLRRFLGKSPLYFVFTATPNLFTPRWFTEGLATQIETDHVNGYGRGQSSYFRALMRMETHGGLKSLRTVNQIPYRWPMGTSWYLYGVYFQQFLVRKYGLAAQQSFLARYSNYVVPYLLNPVMNRTLGKDFYALWDEFLLDTEFRFADELAAIKKQGVIEGERLSFSGYDSGFARSDANGGVFYVRNDLEDTPTLYHLKSAKASPQAIAKVEDKFFDYHPQQGLLLAEYDINYNVNLYTDLIKLDPATGRRERLTRNARYVFGVWSSTGKQIAAVQVHAGMQQLQLLDSNGALRETLAAPQDNVMYNSLDFSADDRTLLASVFRPDAGWNLELFDLATRQWQRVTQSNAIEANARFVPGSSHEIVFSADYDGVYNLYRLDLASKELTKLSNVLGAALDPDFSADGKTLYYRGLHSGGHDLYALAVSTPSSKTSTVTLFDPGYSLAPGYTAPARVASEQEEYDPLRYLKPTAWQPYLLLASTHTELLVLSGGIDPLQLNSYSGGISYDFTYSLLGWSVDYTYARYRPQFTLGNLQRYSYLSAPGSSQVSAVVGDNISHATVSYPFLQRTWALALFAGASSLRSAVEHTEPFVAVETAEELLFGAGLRFSNARHTARAVTPLRGFNWLVVADEYEADLGIESLHRGKAYYQDLNLYSPLLAHTVLHGRFAAGMGAARIEPFEFISNESALAAAPAIGKRDFVLRGYPSGLASLRGTRFALGTADWNFPLATPETGIMLPPIGLNRITGNLFAEAGMAWDRGQSRPSPSRAVGAELVLETMIGFLLPVEVKLGYAKGLDEFGEEQPYVSLGTVF